MGDEHDGEPLLPLLHDVFEKGKDGHPVPPQRSADPVRELLLDLLVLGNGQDSSLSCYGVYSTVYENHRQATIGAVSCQSGRCAGSETVTREIRVSGPIPARLDK
jgi:hypothetical protein